ncbi:MAG: peptidase M10A and M12B matrixin and adamalysin [Verrucomicrobia bacterium]|nr:peptidase M10A and M12B matrixin and adamalysin [Verrucomicrobiota bacterium]
MLSPMRDAKAQLSIRFDYRYDSSGFFDAPERRLVLNAAANEYAFRFGDSLTALTPAGTNSWNALVIRPDTGTMELLSDLLVPANTLTIFVSARPLDADKLGMAEVGGFASRGSPAWQESVRDRGQFGAPKDDFGPWGGSIAFDSNPATRWYFDPDPLSLGDLPSNADDFFSVAVHELGHLFGYGTAASWQLRIDSGFTGRNSVLTFGGPVPVEISGDHWADGTMSRVFGTGLLQEAALAPELPPGSRKFLTDLDIAGLRDIGWSVVPEPGVVWLMILALVLGWLRSRLNHKPGSEAVCTSRFK